MLQGVIDFQKNFGYCFGMPGERTSAPLNAARLRHVAGLFREIAVRLDMMAGQLDGAGSPTIEVKNDKSLSGGFERLTVWLGAAQAAVDEARLIAPAEPLAEYLATRHQRSDADAERIAKEFHDKKKELAAKTKKDAQKPAKKTPE